MRYWIGLGTNLGERLPTLRGAAKALDKIGSVTQRSRIWAASAIGGPPQPPFLNAAVLLTCSLEPAALLRECQRIEAQFGRKRDQEEVRWGPRTLDVDVLLVGDERVDDPDLVVPHPRMTERGFVGVPLADLDPSWCTRIPADSDAVRPTRLALTLPE